MTKLPPYIIDGIEIERVEPRGPYSLIVTFTHGVKKEIANGHDPQAVRAAESRVARNPAVIDRIELRDLDSVLETIWSRTWE